MIPVALSIAGSDPSGGAGIQADLKVFRDLDVYGMAAVSALTVQDTQGVYEVHPVKAELVSDQVCRAIQDIAPAAIKTGMLANGTTAAIVASALASTPAPLVVDPILHASDGTDLWTSSPGAFHPLLARATLVTPNRAEATRLLDGEDPSAWCDRTQTALLITGGPSEGEGEAQEDLDRCTDTLFTPGGQVQHYTHICIQTRNTHGTGCTLSAAITAFLALGLELQEAVTRGIAYQVEALRKASDHPLGQGRGPLLHGVRSR